MKNYHLIAENGAEFDYLYLCLTVDKSNTETVIQQIVLDDESKFGDLNHLTYCLHHFEFFSIVQMVVKKVYSTEIQELLDPDYNKVILDCLTGKTDDKVVEGLAKLKKLSVMMAKGLRVAPIKFPFGDKK